MSEIGYYPVKLEVGNFGMPGAPALNLNLGVDSTSGVIHGTASITQSLPPPYGEIVIPQVSGQLLHTGFGEDVRLVHLHGQYAVSVPPPGIGTYLAPFSAALVVDAAWNGHGSFLFGTHMAPRNEVRNVTKTTQASVIGASAAASS